MIKRAFSLIELSIVILIVGIVIAGVKQSSILIRKFKISKAHSLTQNSPVTSISGLTLWLESTGFDENALVNEGGSTHIEDGDLIRSWSETNFRTTDRKTFTSSSYPTNTDYPAYEANGINDLPSLEFVGSDDLSLTLNISDLVGAQSATFFVVAKLITSDSTNNLFFWRPNYTSPSNGVLVHLEWAGVTYFDYGDSYDVQGRLSYNTPPAIDNPHILTFYRKNDGTQVIRSDGVELTSATKTVQPSGSGLFSIGANPYGSASAGHDGLISEFIVFNRGLKTSEINDIESYLSKKWGIDI